MNVPRKPYAGAVLLAVLLLVSCGATGSDEVATSASGAGQDMASDATSAGGIPQFEYDPTWPRLPLPNQWIFGEVGGLSVDDQGHVWVIHRPWTVTGRELAAVEGEAQCCRVAPSVVEFDQAGNVVQAWPDLQ